VPIRPPKGEKSKHKDGALCFIFARVVSRLQTTVKKAAGGDAILAGAPAVPRMQFPTLAAHERQTCRNPDSACYLLGASPPFFLVSLSEKGRVIVVGEDSIRTSTICCFVHTAFSAGWKVECKSFPRKSFNTPLRTERENGNAAKSKLA
jgi:hypothetical protein